MGESGQERKRQDRKERAVKEREEKIKPSVGEWKPTLVVRARESTKRREKESSGAPLLYNAFVLFVGGAHYSSYPKYI